jgi:nucleoside-diphosphate-sugar epimerase
VHVLLLGGTRFMGYGLAWRLLAGGHRVTVLNRGRTADPFGDRVERLHGDRTQGEVERLLRGRRFDAAVDFSAYHGRDVAEAVEALALGGTRHYVLISTGQVYLVREGAPRPSRESDYAGKVMAEPESEPDRGEWAYGMGKRAAEDVLQEAWRVSRFPGTVLRLPVVNGERDPTRRLESYLWRLLDGGPVLVPDGGAARLRHVYCNDVVRTLDAMLGREDTFGRAYNVCQEEAPTLRELLDELARLLGARPHLVDVDLPRLAGEGLAPRAVSPFSSRWISHLDPGVARAELGFRPTPLAQALESIVTSFLAHLPAEPPENYQGRAREVALASAILQDGQGGRR